MYRDEKVKAIARGERPMPELSIKKPRTFVRRPTDPKPQREKRDIFGLITIPYECECGKKYPETKKQCPNCKRVNQEYLQNHWTRTEK